MPTNEQKDPVKEARDIRAMTSETLVREWANFHPDIPLTKSYADLVRRVEAARGCRHCTCSCVNCAPCGEDYHV